MRILALGAVVFVVAAPAAGRDALPRESNLLVALPALGSVTWRCGPGRDVYRLAYREFWSSATTGVTLRAGGRTVRKTVDPRQAVSFPFSRAAVQRLTFVQATEPGTLRAVVTVRFGETSPAYPPCQAYLPPRFEVALYPRPNGR